MVHQNTPKLKTMECNSPPYAGVYVVVGVVPPALRDVPHPTLVPPGKVTTVLEWKDLHDDQPGHMHEWVEGPPPALGWRWHLGPCWGNMLVLSPFHRTCLVWWCALCSSSTTAPLSSAGVRCQVSGGLLARWHLESGLLSYSRAILRPSTPGSLDRRVVPATSHKMPLH